MSGEAGALIEAVFKSKNKNNLKIKTGDPTQSFRLSIWLKCTE